MAFNLLYLLDYIKNILFYTSILFKKEKIEKKILNYLLLLFMSKTISLTLKPIGRV
jgi:hypothetical protein